MLVQSANVTLEMFGTPNTGCAAVIAVQVEDFNNSETRHVLQPPLSSDTPSASTREAPDFAFQDECAWTASSYRRLIGRLPFKTFKVKFRLEKRRQFEGVVQILFL